MVVPFVRRSHITPFLVILSLVFIFFQLQINKEFFSILDLQEFQESAAWTWKGSYAHVYNGDFKPPNTPGAFIHVGKTGGSTLSLLLRNGCHSFVPKPCVNRHTGKLFIPKNATDETMVSKLTTYYHNPDFEIGTDQRYEFYVITIRDPLDRIVSAYLQNHPENLKAFVHYNIQNDSKYQDFLKNNHTQAAQQFYDKKWEAAEKRFDYFGRVYQCMPTLDVFAQMLKGGEMSILDVFALLWARSEYDCSQKTKLIFFHNSASQMAHFNWNLQSILERLHINIHQSSIFLIRTEYLNQDWIQTNQYLGQPAEQVKVPEFVMRNASTFNYPIQNILSDSGREILCQALKPEYEMFMKLLSSAVNLSTEQKQQSLNMVQTKCPWLSLKLEA